MRNEAYLNNRRDFIKKTAAVSTAMAFGGVLPMLVRKVTVELKEQMTVLMFP